MFVTLCLETTGNHVYVEEFNRVVKNQTPLEFIAVALVIQVSSPSKEVQGVLALSASDQMCTFLVHASIS